MELCAYNNQLYTHNLVQDHFFQLEYAMDIFTNTMKQIKINTFYN